MLNSPNTTLRRVLREERTKYQRKNFFQNTTKKIYVLQCDANVRLSDIESESDLEKESEKDIDIEKNINIELDKTTTACTRVINEPLTELRVTVHNSWGVPVSATLLISNSQLKDLEEHLSRDELAHYIGKMQEMVLDNYHFSCSHYEFILQMVEKDRGIREWPNGNS